jgi:hypothetical protein
MNAYRKELVYNLSFLNPTLFEGKEIHDPAALTGERTANTHSIAGLVDSKVNLDALSKSLISFPDDGVFSDVND